MYTSFASNVFLALGIVALIWFGALEALALQADPLIPASAALFIGCTAVLDRVSIRKRIE